MLLLNSHLLLLLLYCQSQVVRAYSSNGAENCLPRCCSQGQILDPSGTACLKNPATQILPDPCGRRDSFLPQCELENNEEDEESGMKRRRQPLVESIQKGQRNLQHKQVLQGLGEYSIEIHGEVLRSYYYSSGSSEEPIRRKNESMVRGDKMAGSEVMTKAIKRHEIPSSFCIDPDNQKLLLCPRVELNKRTKVYKCCPFGKQLKDPLFTGCEPIKSTSTNWGMPIQGRRISLADLIRFPSESLKYDKSFHKRLDSSNPCDAHGSRSRLLFDYEAFQVDRHGSLVFTRTLGDQAIDDFCVDQVAVRRGPKGNTDQGHLFMAAVFCQPSNVTEVDETLQLLNLPNNSPLLRGNGLHFMLILLANVRAML